VEAPAFLAAARAGGAGSGVSPRRRGDTAVGGDAVPLLLLRWLPLAREPLGLQAGVRVSRHLDGAGCSHAGRASVCPCSPATSLVPAGYPRLRCPRGQGSCRELRAVAPLLVQTGVRGGEADAVGACPAARLPAGWRSRRERRLARPPAARAHGQLKHKSVRNRVCSFCGWQKGFFVKRAGWRGPGDTPCLAAAEEPGGCPAGAAPARGQSSQRSVARSGLELRCPLTEPPLRSPWSAVNWPYPIYYLWFCINDGSVLQWYWEAFVRDPALRRVSQPRAGGGSPRPAEFTARFQPPGRLTGDLTQIAWDLLHAKNKYRRTRSPNPFIFSSQLAEGGKTQSGERVRSVEERRGRKIGWSAQKTPSWQEAARPCASFPGRCRNPRGSKQESWCREHLAGTGGLAWASRDLLPQRQIFSGGTGLTLCATLLICRHVLFCWINTVSGHSRGWRSLGGFVRVRPVAVGRWRRAGCTPRRRGYLHLHSNCFVLRNDLVHGGVLNLICIDLSCFHLCILNSER